MSDSDRPSSSARIGRPSLAAAVRTCRAQPELLAELTKIYHHADAEIAHLNPACLGGGACCRFDLAGHRLYLTAIELAYLTGVASPCPTQAAQERCSYQLGPRCAAHDNRPLGCRTYFCDEASSEALRAVHERYHRRIRVLHVRWNVAYLYAELTSSLRELNSGIRSAVFCVDSARTAP